MGAQALGANCPGVGQQRELAKGFRKFLRILIPFYPRPESRTW